MPASLPVPLRTIVVATLQRSGSNLLCELMTQTGRLGHPKEYFNPYALRSTYPGRGATVEDRCRLAREEGATPNGVVGIKLFPEYMPSPRSGVRFSDWFGTPHWVWLRRRDIVGQAVSLVLARQERRYASFDEARRVPAYSGEEIFRAAEEITGRNGRWEAYFARTGQTPLALWYEDVETDGMGAIGSIAAAAGVDLGPFELQPASMFRKQRSEVNAEWRERFLAEMGDPDLFSLPRPGVLRRLGRLFGVHRG